MKPSVSDIGSEELMLQEQMASNALFFALDKRLLLVCYNLVKQREKKTTKTLILHRMRVGFVKVSLPTDHLLTDKAYMLETLLLI